MTEPAATAQLQLALDDITREEIFPLLEKIEGFVDIVEVGSGITGAPDVAAEAARLHEIIRGAHQ